MTIEALALIALVAAGAYRLYKVRHDRDDLIMWSFGIAALAVLFVSKVLPGLQVALLVLGVLLLVPFVIMSLRKPHRDPDDTIRRPPG